VNFVSSGKADYSWNVANASPGHSDFGHQTGWWIFQGTPVVHPNNIAASLSNGYSIAYSQVIGTVGAHELVHRITGIGDLPYDASSPADLMRIDDPKNTKAMQLLVTNGLGLTPNEGLRVQAKCLRKHPE